MPGGGENWKRNLNHARHQGWTGEEDRQRLERLRQEHKLAGSSLKKQAKALDEILPCYQAKGEMRWGSKEEVEKHLSQHKEEKDRRHKEEKDRRHKETDRRGELKRKREALEREEQELMMEEQEQKRRQEEEEKERKKLREEEEKERKKLMKWENEKMQEEDLQTTLWLLDEEMAAEKQRSKKMKQEKAERLEEKEEKEEKGHSALDQLVEMFRDSWSSLCDVEITGLKVKMRNRERSKNFYLAGEEMREILGPEIEALERAFSSKVWISIAGEGGGSWGLGLGSWVEGGVGRG